MSPQLRLSLLDLAFVGRHQTTAEALQDSVAMAKAAEATGRFERIWYAEHHNMAQIASAATSVLIAHVAANTSTIKLGSGGVMLPNHSPLVIAEQYGTLAELHPGRIDLGLGRAPGTDQTTVRALRRDPYASDRFPDDVRELQGFLGDESPVPGVVAHPGRGTHVPLYILGSSLFGAQLAAAFGLPYAFASHFAPDYLEQAVAVYRERFQPSAQCEQPQVIAACNVVAADEAFRADQLAEQVLRGRVRSLAERVPGYAALFSGPEAEQDEAVDALMDSPVAAQARHMMRHTVVGDQESVAQGLADFRDLADADEVMVTNAAPSLDDRLRALEIMAQVR
ncbi:LLM class flavin-dependent oxidoreductase [Aestuariimicrobium ganziense]|uniref:LLM class flavin-dependent oxidoreductase n=1 Tax=Aestuariimicrobium ganziense TaxID=2773677 RepID=UPI0019431C8F|nr:LLM class flavin-dependent oxidoreductase [Aestuariimicrobium ganziense]